MINTVVVVVAAAVVVVAGERVVACDVTVVADVASTLPGSVAATVACVARMVYLLCVATGPVGVAGPVVPTAHRRTWNDPPPADAGLDTRLKSKQYNCQNIACRVEVVHMAECQP